MRSMIHPSAIVCLRSCVHIISTIILSHFEHWWSIISIGVIGWLLSIVALIISRELAILRRLKLHHTSSAMLWVSHTIWCHVLWSISKLRFSSTFEMTASILSFFAKLFCFFQLLSFLICPLCHCCRCTLISRVRWISCVWWSLTVSWSVAKTWLVHLVYVWNDLNLNYRFDFEKLKGN